MTNLKEEIRKILRGCPKDNEDYDDFPFLQLTELFRQAMLEVIGEDNGIDPEDPDGYLISGGMKKNELRAEMRERVEKMIGKE